MALLRWIAFFILWSMLTAGFGFTVMALLTGSLGALLISVPMMYLGYRGVDYASGWD